MAISELSSSSVHPESANTQNPQATSQMEVHSVKEWLGEKLYRRTYRRRVSYVDGQRFVDLGAMFDTTLGSRSYEVIGERPKKVYERGRPGRRSKEEQSS